MNQAAPPQFKTVSGRWVVIGMLAFGVLATGTLWVYSKLELAPFLPKPAAVVTDRRVAHETPWRRLVIDRLASDRAPPRSCRPDTYVHPVRTGCTYVSWSREEPR